MKTSAEKWKARQKRPCTVCGKPTGWCHKDTRAPADSTHPGCRPVEHGTPKMYKAGCRCQDCREYNRLTAAAYRARRRAEGRPVESGGARRWILDSARMAIYERDEWTCQLCMGSVDRTLSGNDLWSPSLDHIVPQSQGQPDHSPANLRLAHRWCNSVRGDGHLYDDSYFKAAA